MLHTDKRFRHGFTKTPVYNSWVSMIDRCLNKNCPAFHNYGGRGIIVCEKWMRFENFLKDMGDRPIGHTLDRFPNKNGNYEPSNCRWATPKEQGRNKRNNVYFEYNGIKKTLSEWHELWGVTTGSIQHHIKKGKTFEKVFEFYEAKKIKKTI